MKRLLSLLPVALIAALLMASPAPATTSPISIGIGAQAQFVNAGELLLPVTYNCPTSTVSASITARVFEQSTGGTGFSNSVLLPCTGSNANAVLHIFGGPFTIGKAFANATMLSAAFAFFQTDQRQIQITL